MRHQLILVAAGFGALAACSPADNPVSQPSDLKAWAQDFFEAEKAAFERANYAALERLEHPDVVFQNIDGTVFRTWEGHRQAIEDFRAAFGGAPITQQWTYLMGDDELFTASYVWDVAVPDKPVQIRGILVGRVVDGKLVEEWGASRQVDPADAP